MQEVKRSFAAVMRGILAFTLAATMLVTSFAFSDNVPKVFADDGSNLSFELEATSSMAGGTTTIVYELKNINVATADYQSIMVSFPSMLAIHTTSPTGWTLTSSTTGTISTYSYVVTTPSTQGTAAQVTTFLDSLSFSATEPPDGSAGIKVSISPNKMSSYVDENENEHFYEVVTSASAITWMDAYNGAKAKEYRGMQGYLATITSQEEQNMIYRTITSNTAWLGGTRMLMATSSGSGTFRRINDDASVLPFGTKVSGSTAAQAYTNNWDMRPVNTPVWYWACGPETGQVFYNYTTYNTANNTTGTYYRSGTTYEAHPTYHGDYGFFNAGSTAITDNGSDAYGDQLKPAGSVTGSTTSTIYSASSNEPNNSSATGAACGEYVLQFAYSSRPSWNDFPYNGAVQAYIVEYGGYDPADVGNGKHPLPDVNEHEELPPVPVTVNYASRLNPDDPLTGLMTIHLTGNKVGDQFVAEPLEIPGYIFVGFDAENNNTDPVAVYHEGSFTWTDSDGITHTESQVVVGQISGWVQDITFLYQPKSSTVTFHPNYNPNDPNYWEGLGTVAPQTKSVTYDAQYGSLATASREGYTLAGWSLDPNCSPTDTANLITNETLVKQESNHTLYAIWAPKPNYSVHYDLNGGTLRINSTDYTTIPDKTKVSWADAELLSGTPSDTAGADYTNQNAPVWDNPTRNYYFFTGWYVSLNGAGSDINNSHVYGDLAANDRNAFIEVRAQWSRNGTFAVKYQLNGGTIDGQGAISNKNDLSEGDTELIPSTDPVRPGYEFLGWKLTKRGTVAATDDPPVMVDSQMTYGQVAPTEPDDRTITLEAQWAPQSYTVHYDLAGGLISGSTEVAPKTVLYTDRNLVDGLNPTRPDEANGDSWIFSGWVLSKLGVVDADGSRIVTAADSYGELAQDDTITSITLEAQWSPAIRYMVSYDLNGGAVGEDTTLPDKAVAYTEAGLLPVDNSSQLIIPTKTGYDFAGWRQLYKNGTLSADTIGQNHQYDWLSESPTDRYVTLQAQWTARTGFIVKYDSNNDGAGLDPAERSVSWETTGLLPIQAQTNQISIPSGKYLAGWKIVAINDQPVANHEVFNTVSYGSLVSDQDDLSITLQAIWENTAVYTVQYDSNGGTPPNVGSRTLTADTQTVLPAPQTLTRVGYDFVGWTVTENRHANIAADYIVQAADTFADLVAESQFQPFYTIKLQAQWTPKTIFTVKYISSDLQDDPVGSLSDKEGVAWSGQSLLPTPTPTWSHHTLVGWKLVAASADGTGDVSLGNVYPAGENAFITEGFSYATLANYILSIDLLSVDDADKVLSLTLRPVWVEEAKYNVNYDLDGGTYNSSSTYPSATVYWSDGVLPKDSGGSDITPVKPGFTFAGWRVSANASAEGALLDRITDEHTYGFLAVDPSVAFIRLRAQWIANVYTVNYDLNFTEGTSDPASYVSRTDVGYSQTNLYPVNPNRNPKREGSGFSFAGWYTKADDTGFRVELTTAYSTIAGADSVSAITLYAHWADSSAVVTFDRNNTDAEGATDATPISQLVNMDEPYGGIPNENVYPSPLPVGANAPGRIGYTFSGWYTQPTGGTRVYDDTIVTTAGDHILYARWTPKNNYEVVYNYQDETGNLATPKTDSRSPLAWNATGLLPTQPTRTGWTFAGWWTESGGSEGGGTQVTASTQYGALAFNNQGNIDDTVMSVTIYAHWTLKAEYEVVYDLNGADHVDGDPVSEGAGVDPLNVSSWLQASLMPEQSVEKYGYTLTGWQLTARTTTDGTTPVAGGTIVMTSNNTTTTYAALTDNNDSVTQITLTAQWTARNDSVLTFNGNHNNAIAGDTPSLTGLIFNQTLTAQGEALPATGTDIPTLTGYTFIGWNTTAGVFKEGIGTVADADATTVLTPDFTNSSNVDWTGAKTVYAVWSARTDMVLNFDANEGTAGTTTTKSGLTYGAAAGTLPATGSGAPTRVGYVFQGWSTSSGANNTVNFTDESLVNWPPTTTTVYAVWAAREDIVLNFNANGGDAGDLTQWNDLEYGKTLTVQGKTLPVTGADIPTNPGYSFVGWNTTPGTFKAGVGTVANAGDTTVLEPDFTNESLVNWTTPKTVYAVWEAKTFTIHYLPGTATEGETTNTAYWYEDAVPGEDFNGVTGWGSQNLSPMTGEKIYSIPDVTGATWMTPNLIPPRWLYMDNFGDNDEIVYHFAGWVLVDNDTHEPIPDKDIVVPETLFGELVVEDSVTEITLMGTWTKSYAVFYDPAGGEYAEGEGYSLNADYYTEQEGSGDPGDPVENVTFRSAPTRTGYIFAGWQLTMRDATGVTGGTVYLADTSTTYAALAEISSGSVAANVTLTAKWDPTEDNVLIFDANGGTTGTTPQWDDLVYSQTLTTQSKTLPIGEEDDGAPTRTGYTLVGWDTQANFFTAGVGTVTANGGTTPVSPDFTEGNTVNWVGEKTVYAVWRVTVDNTLSFDSNHDDASAAPAQIIDLTYDKTLTAQGKTLPAVGTGAPTLMGYTFLGWDEQENYFTPGVGTVTANGGTTLVTPGFTAANTVNWAGDKTVYAVWQAIPNNKVVFNKNDTYATGTMSDQSFAYEETNELSLNEFTKPGYDFAGWATSAEGEAVYDDGDDYTYNPDPYVDEMTLYAVWEESAPVTFHYVAMTVDDVAIIDRSDDPDMAANDGEAAGGSVEPYIDNAVAPATGAPSSAASAKAGYRFVGWYSSYTNGSTNSPVDGSWVSGTTIAPTKDEGAAWIDDTTYYAVFRENVDVTIIYTTVTYDSAGVVDEDNAGGRVNPGNESLPPATGTARGSTATASPGYTFMGWYTEGSDYTGTPNSSTESTFVPGRDGNGIYENATYVAVFKEKNNVIYTYTAMTTNPDAAGGTVKIGSNDAAVSDTESVAPATGTALGATAIPDPGYHFVGWYRAADTSFTTKIGIAAKYTPSKSGGEYAGGSYVALFAENASVTITYNAVTRSGPVGGTVNLTGDDPGNAGPSVTESVPPVSGAVTGATAIPASGYQFVGWYLAADNGYENPLSEDLSFVPEKTGGANIAATYVALFEEVGAVTVTYTAMARTSDGTIVSGGGRVSRSTETVGPSTGTISGSTAAALSGFDFVGWYAESDGDFVTELAGGAATFIPPQVGGLNVAGDYIALFEESGEVTITYTASEGGQVQLGEGTAAASVSEDILPVSGTAAGATAIPSPGYQFVGWYDSRGVTRLSEDLQYIPQKTGDVYIETTYLAMFGEIVNVVNNYKVEHYFVDATGAPALHETETLNAQINTIVTATPKTGYRGYTYTPGFDSGSAAEILSGTVPATGTLTLKLYYIVETFSITYTITGDAPVGGPSVPGPFQDVAYGTTQDIAENLTSGSYIFTGWRTSDCAVNGNTFVMPDKDVTFTGSWIKIVTTTYKVNHYRISDGGPDLLQTETFAAIAGAQVTAVPKTGIAGYTYRPGYGDEILSGVVAEDGSLELRLYYAVNTYNITYEVYGDIPDDVTLPGAPAAATGAAYGSTQSVKDATEQMVDGTDAYVFSGWQTSDAIISYAEDSTKYDFTMPDKDVAFSGYWIKKEDAAGYTVQYWLVNADGEETLAEEFIGAVGEQVSVTPTDEYPGYHRDNAEEVLQGEVVSDGSLVLKVYYVINRHDIGFEFAGDVPDDATVPTGSSEEPYGSDQEVPDDLQPGDLSADGTQMFSGWQTEDCFVGADGSFVMPDNNVMFLGLWLPLSGSAYSVKHYGLLPDGQGNPTTLLGTEIGYGIAGTQAEAQDQDHPGYTYADGSANEVKTGLILENGGLVLALFYEPLLYEVSYSYSGDVPAGAPAPPGLSADVAFSTTQSVAANPVFGGYIFSGWSTSDATVDGLAFAMPDHDVAFTGSWTKNPELHLVTFVNHNGESLEFVYVPDGWAAPAPDPPARPGFTFIGWDTDFSNVTSDLTVRALYEQTNVVTPAPDPSGGENSSSLSRTGDAANPLFLAVIALLALLSILGLAYRLRRSN